MVGGGGHVGEHGLELGSHLELGLARHAVQEGGHVATLDIGIRAEVGGTITVIPTGGDTRLEEPVDSREMIGGLVYIGNGSLNPI